MKKIGVLVGREESFPEALIAEVNRRNAGAKAEMAIFEGTPHDHKIGYDVILDRISHEVNYYQTTLKIAVLNGCEVINNPFWKLADDKFFGTTLVERLGIAVPRTVALPQRKPIEGISEKSLRNLRYPLDWEGITSWIGWPAIIKPHWGGGWKSVDKVANMEELMRAYDASKDLCMILQEFIDWQQYVRCICIGKENIKAVAWDPSKPHHERYAGADFDIPDRLMAEIVDKARRINRALGYDMNTVEFAIRDGVPYAIDFMNSAPDFDRSSLTGDQFDWVVKAVADLVLERAHAPRREPPAMRWDQFLSA